MAQISILKTEQLIENKMHKQELRPYLGMSSIGGDCKRKIWYQFRWVKQPYIHHRVYRLFNRGEQEEDVVISDLESIGCEIIDRQKEIKDDTGHFIGHIDGIILNLPDIPDQPVLLEVKTANQSNFQRIKKYGVKAYSEAYWAQIHLYMGYLNLDYCFYVVTNKNTDERHYELVKFDYYAFEDYKNIALDILQSEAPPPRIGNRVFFKCKFCEFSDVCHDRLPIMKTCRTCKFCDIEIGGVFRCSLSKKILSEDDQLRACDKYESIIEEINE